MIAQDKIWMLTLAGIGLVALAFIHVIANAGKPVAQLIAVPQAKSPRKPGNDAGKIIIMPDFDDPLPEFDL